MHCVGQIAFLLKHSLKTEYVALELANVGLHPLSFTVFLECFVLVSVSFAGVDGSGLLVISTVSAYSVVPV